MSKRLFICLLAFALAATCSVTLYAQETTGGGQQQGGERRMGGPGGRGMMMTPQAELERLTSELNLTKDQQDKIKPILEDQQKQMKEVRDASNGERPDMAKMREIRKSHMDQIQAVLTAEQKTKWEDMQKKMMERGGGRRGGEGGQGGGTPPPPPPQL